MMGFVTLNAKDTQCCARSSSAHIDVGARVRIIPSEKFLNNYTHMNIFTTHEYVT